MEKDICHCQSLSVSCAAFPKYNLLACFSRNGKTTKRGKHGVLIQVSVRNVGHYTWHHVLQSPGSAASIL